jgi:hypothetical protein
MSITVSKDLHISEAGRHIGQIAKDSNGDYLLFCSNPHLLGKGKCMKEIAELLIKLNYEKVETLSDHILSNPFCGVYLYKESVEDYIRIAKREIKNGADPIKTLTKLAGDKF